MAAIETDGSPNMRERVARVETTVLHLMDPETGIYPSIQRTSAEITRSEQRLRSWALVLLTALLLNLVALIIHLTTTGGL